MSGLSDESIGRYIDHSAQRRTAYRNDPQAHFETEMLRMILDSADRAMADEEVPEEARRRVINRVVWGDPDGVTDAHARNTALARALAAADST